jgi:hypothetical protein
MEYIEGYKTQWFIAKYTSNFPPSIDILDRELSTRF